MEASEIENRPLTPFPNISSGHHHQTSTVQLFDPLSVFYLTI